MLRTKDLLMTLESPLMHGLCLLVLALLCKCCTKLANTGESIRMLRSKDLFTTLECPSVHGLCILILALVIKY
jgi:hypothetical protein